MAIKILGFDYGAPPPEINQSGSVTQRPVQELCSTARPERGAVSEPRGGQVYCDMEAKHAF